jgi:hypothetical protein
VANEEKMSKENSQEMLKEILNNQKEALNLNGQLVLLNEKMDTLIDCVGQKMTPNGIVASIIHSPPALIAVSIVAVIMLFLGLGDGLMDRMLGEKPPSTKEIIELLTNPGASATPLEEAPLEAP